MNNPFEIINTRLTNLEALAIEVLQLLQASNTTQSLDKEKYLNVSEAAKYLGISKQTVYQNIDKIPHCKRFGRNYFQESKLDSYIEAGTQKKA